MVRARYTSSKFCSGQLRVVCDNAYRTEGAASLSPGSISELQFWELIEPAFHNEVRGAHVGAVFKRSVIILNTKEHLVVKLAGQPTATVYALPPDASYISPESPGLLKSYYEDNILRDNFELLVKEEGIWMNELMSKKELLPLPAPSSASSAPRYEDMTQQQVRDYIDEHEGLQYPIGFPDHKKWQTPEQRQRLAEAAAEGFASDESILRFSKKNVSDEEWDLDRFRMPPPPVPPPHLRAGYAAISSGSSSSSTSSASSSSSDSGAHGMTDMVFASDTDMEVDQAFPEGDSVEEELLALLNEPFFPEDFDDADSD